MNNQSLRRFSFSLTTSKEVHDHQLILYKYENNNKNVLSPSQEKRWLRHEQLSFKEGTKVVTEDSKAFSSS